MEGMKLSEVCIYGIITVKSLFLVYTIWNSIRFAVNSVLLNAFGILQFKQDAPYIQQASFATYMNLKTACCVPSISQIKVEGEKIEDMNQFEL
jgi:hypothetical protein